MKDEKVSDIGVRIAVWNLFIIHHSPFVTLP